MDYDFEAPTYVNFAEAMDEDESEISRYFDVEHEDSFSRGKGTPGVVLPGGPRSMSAKKGPANEKVSTSLNTSGTVQRQSPSESEKQSKTPAERRSSGRLRTSTVKTPKRKTPSKLKSTSVKRLGRAKSCSTTPGKMVAALTALKLTPAKTVVAAPASTSKRTRKETMEQLDASPSKRVKLTPKSAASTLSNLEVSPPAVNMDGLLHQAIKNLRDSSRKVKQNQAGTLVSFVDGIEVPHVPEKEHQMETRADKAARDPPIQLRSRSIVKASVERKIENEKVLGSARGRSLSGDRILKPVNVSNHRARSIDRLQKPIQASKVTEPFVSLAEATSRFQNRTPLRFRMRRQNSPGIRDKGPVLALKATIPQSPALRVKYRNRPVTALTREEQEARELDEIRKNKFKPLPLPDKILKSIIPAPKILKKPPTLPEPFKLTEIKKKDVNVQLEPVKFIARPVPKKILEGPVGIAEKKLAPLTEPKSPSFRADALKRAKEVNRRITPVKHMSKIIMKVLEANDGVQVVKDKQLGHFGVPSTAQTVKTATEVKPFSFEERDKERVLKKEEKLRELQKQLSQKSTFHANPLPSFKTPPRTQRSASPAVRSKTPNYQRSLKGLESKTSRCDIPKPKPALIPQFKARAPTVLHRKPFEPVKPNRQLPLPDVTLASEIRAKDREAYDRQLMQREQEMEAARQLLKAEQEKKEKEEVTQMRKQAVHKPNPVPKVKPFEPQPSNKALTDPNTPFCLKRSRKLTVV